MEIFHQQQTKGQPSIDCLSGWSISPFKKAIQELNPLGPLGHHLPVGFYFSATIPSCHSFEYQTRHPNLARTMWVVQKPCGYPQKKIQRCSTKCEYWNNWNSWKTWYSPMIFLLGFHQHFSWYYHDIPLNKSPFLMVNYILSRKILKRSFNPQWLLAKYG